MDNFLNEEFRFGSARFANETEIRKAGLLSGKGLPVGFLGKQPLHLDSDGPAILIAGSGSGKLRDELSYVVINSPGERKVIQDPKGEIYAISHHVFAERGEYLYSFNPYRLHGFPNHGFNPLSILDPQSVTFHSDCQLLFKNMIPQKSKGDGIFFENRAREWVGAIAKSDLYRNGKTSLPSIHRLINSIEGDQVRWLGHLEYMVNCHDESVRRIGAEMLAKQQDSPKEFGSVMGEVYNNFGWLDEPAISNSLENPDFCLSALCDEARVCHLSFLIPAEYLKSLSCLMRTTLTALLLHKSRKPMSARINLILDEAAQLGTFPELETMMTYGRGIGIRPKVVFQDIGQIKKLYGNNALQTFIGSSVERKFFGVRDYETALYVSNSLGKETLSYDDISKQQAAQRHKMQAANELLSGDDPFAAALKLKHFSQEETLRTKMVRHLRSPDEILNMHEDQMLLFIAGMNLRPILANKYPYFKQRSMAGRFLPNPYHPPLDHVLMKRRFGYKKQKVITEPVPAEFRDFPQYQSGFWTYPQGYRPKKLP